jgi:4-hydroxy-tetrahydrodipicolinate reductase
MPSGGRSGKPGAGAGEADFLRGRFLKVVVAGASGRMGREVLTAVDAAPDLALVGAVSRGLIRRGEEAKESVQGWLTARGVPAFDAIAAGVRTTLPDVVIEFTSAAVAPEIMRVALRAGVPVVSGTTGIPAREMEDLKDLAERAGLGLIVIPNFSLGATILGILARTAAPYFREAEIVESHHDQKRDAPSGTALVLARTIGAGLAVASDKPDGGEGGRTGGGSHAGVGGQIPLSASPGDGRSEPCPAGMASSRGLVVDRVPVHSVRLSGLVAHHEIIFASAGETLTLRHDSVSRASFMPGVLLAARNAGRIKGLVTSLETLLQTTRPDSRGV